MSRKNILITGAGGFIGFELATYFARQGHQVTGVDVHFPYPDESLPFDAHVSDFRDASVMKPLLKGIDVVFHLASAHLSIRLEESEYWDINVHSLPALLSLAHAQGVEKFVHVSSVGVYGNLTHWPANEQTACTPQSIYGETKLAGEREVSRFGTESGLGTLTIRPAWVFGASCPRTRKLYRTLKKKTFVMIGQGDNLRHPIYIADMIKAFDLCMDYDAVPGETIIVGGDHAISTMELIETMCRVFELQMPWLRIPVWAGDSLAVTVETGFTLLHREPPVSRRSLEFFKTNNAFDISKAREALHFNPDFSFEEGLLECRESLITPDRPQQNADKTMHQAPPVT